MPDWSEAIRARLENLRIDAAREADVVEELSQHLDERYEELKRAGASDADANRIALDELLAPDVLTERMGPLKQAQSSPPLPSQNANGSWFASSWLDLRYAVRSLRTRRRFTIAIVLTLALGIGANTAIFSLVNATLLARLPVPDREQLVYVTRGDGGTFAYPHYEALRNGAEMLDGLAAWGEIVVSMNAADAAELVPGYIVTGNFFDVMRVGAARGRLLTTADDVTPGAHPVVVISHDFWQTRFASRDDVIGKDVRLNDQPFTIVGVAPAGFPGPNVGGTGALYVPMMMQAVVRPPRAGFSGEQDPDLLRDTRSWLLAVARLKNGVTAGQAQPELATLGTNYVRAAALPGRAEGAIVVPVDELDTAQRGQMRSIAWLLGGVVAAVLLIACANVANLLLTKAASRRLEFAVRLAMGASRVRLVRQLLVESLLMALAGGVLGVALAMTLAAAFRAAPPPAGALPIAVDFSIDARVLAFTLALSVLTGFVFGIVPALKASRPSLVPALKDSSFDSDEGGRRMDVKKPLVVAQVALSLMLLIAAGLFVRGLDAARRIELGFDAERLVTAPLDINLLRYTTAQGREFYRQALERVEQVPGVEAATVARVAVMTGGARTIGNFMVEGRDPPGNDSFQREGAPVAAMPPNFVNANVVGPRFFETLGIALLRGRDFGATDIDGAALVAIVNESLARRHFADGNPLGQRVSFTGAAGPWRTIVGVVRDSKYAELAEQAPPVVYMPLSQNHETGMTLYVRGLVAPESLVGSIRREIQALAPALPVSNVRPMMDTIGAALYSARMSTWLLASFGALALALAAIGIYGVLSFAIASRTREIGIRLALGAGAKNVFNTVVRDGFVLVGIGVTCGVAGALALARTLAGFLYGVSPADAATYVAVTAVLCVVAVVACAIPARRAMRMDPMVALRYQ